MLSGMKFGGRAVGPTGVIITLTVGATREISQYILRVRELLMGVQPLNSGQQKAFARRLNL